jgi:hypothetical protein
MKQKIWNKLYNSIGHDEVIDLILNNYVRKFNKYKKPSKKDRRNYIGLEVECFGPLDCNQVTALILDYDLEKYIQIAHDGSIRPETGKNNTYELRILCPENKLIWLFNKLTKFFKAGKFSVNTSCGSHVHLDMRNRNVTECYNKLLKFQHILFGLVSPKRWNNDYCKWSLESMTFGQSSSRFKAINDRAYGQHKTLEIRLHEGTLDMKKIQNWINLLLKAIGSKSIPEVNTKDDVVKWVAKDRQLKSYVNKEFNSLWFEKRKKIIQKVTPFNNLTMINNPNNIDWGP